MSRTLRMRRCRRVRFALTRRNVTGAPRLSVYRSLRHISVQLIDDAQGKTLVSASTMEPSIREARLTPVEASRRVGACLAERAQKINVKCAVFDRGPMQYHGRVRAVAEGAREAGLKI